jgi:hypothetical protein
MIERRSVARRSADRGRSWAVDHLVKLVVAGAIVLFGASLAGAYELGWRNADAAVVPTVAMQARAVNLHQDSVLGGIASGDSLRDHRLDALEGLAKKVEDTRRWVWCHGNGISMAKCHDIQPPD